MAGFYSEYFDGTNYIPCSFFKWNGSSDEQVYQITYFNGSSDVVIGDLPSSSMMVDGYFDWNVPDSTDISSYGWSNPNWYGVNGNRLWVKPGFGTWGVSTSYNSSLNYNTLEIAMPAGWTGNLNLYGFGVSNNHYINITTTSIQLRIGGVWMRQVSGVFNTAYNTFGIRRAGANVEVIVNGNVILTAAGTVPANGSVGLMLVPGTDTSTTFIDYIRFF